MATTRPSRPTSPHIEWQREDPAPEAPPQARVTWPEAAALALLGFSLTLLIVPPLAAWAADLIWRTL